MTHRAYEAEDVQGLVRSGYARLSDASYLLLRVRDAAAARLWLGALPVTSAAHLDRHVPSALQVALSADGLRRLGLPATILAGFSAEFLSGMAGDAARSRRLGDIGANAPQLWEWGGRETPDILLALYAEGGALPRLRDGIATPPFLSGVEIVADLATSDMGGREPFGFVDGVSQPNFDLSGARRKAALGRSAPAYRNALAAGELLLGYRNEYGQIGDRPLVPPDVPGAGLLPSAGAQSGLRDLGRNGTYLIFRQLAQDVRRFWRFAAEHAVAADGTIRLAEAMVGRRLLRRGAAAKVSRSDSRGRSGCRRRPTQ